MDIKAILFDKDGTLIDFDAFWIPVSAAAVKDILSRAGAGDDMLTEVLGALGIHGDTTDPDGLLCRGTYGEMGLKIRGVLSEHGIRLSEEEAMRMTGDAFSHSAGAGTVKPVCAGLRGVLERLKERGIRLLVVTTDNPEVTHICLEKLNIEDLFEKVIADDGVVPPKPDPRCALDFAGKSGIPVGEIAMVGDTLTDIEFARNAGMRMIYVGKSSEAGKLADARISDVSHIFEIIGERR